MRMPGTATVASLKAKAAGSRWLMVLVLLGVVAALAAACGADATATPTATSAPTATATQAPGDTPLPPPTPTPTVDPFVQEWEDLIAAAKEEGRLEVAFTASGGRAFSNVLQNHFGKQFGINVVMGLGSSREQSARINAEQAAGRYTVDVLGTGVTSSNRLAAKDGLEPLEPWLIHPDVKDPSLWQDGRFWWADPATQKFILIYAATRSGGGNAIINTNLVGPDDIQSVWDIVDPKWKGMIVANANPLNVQITAGVLVELNRNDSMKEWMTKYWTEMDVVIIDDSRLFLDSIARGTFAIGETAAGGGTLQQEILEMQTLGLPIKLLNFNDWPPSWQATGNMTLAVVKNPPNPAAAKLLVNWQLSEEGWAARMQDIIENADNLGRGYMESVSLHTRRSDDHVLPEMRIPEDQLFYLRYTDPLYLDNVAEAEEWLRKTITDAGITY